MKKKESGQPLLLHSYKGRIHEAYNHPDFIQAISDCHSLLNDPEAEILLDSRNRVGVAALPLQGQKKVDVVIKEFRSRGVNKLKSLFLSGKAFRAWQGGMALKEKEIDTPPPVAYLEKRKGLFLDESFFLTERISDVREIRFLFLELPSGELRDLLASLSRYLSICHERGVLHRDLSDGNILVKKGKPGEFRFYLIDTNRIRIKRRIGPLKRIKNLIRLGIPPGHQRFFLEQYLGEDRVKGFFWFWYRLNKMVYSNTIKLKKKLRLRQLARKFKIQ
jgi:serine/threonine protein kinase